MTNTPNHEQFPGTRVAILATDGFEQIELTSPRKALDDAGVQTDLVSLQHGQVRGWNHTEWGDGFEVDVRVDEAQPDTYHALLLPGGVMNPDKLRTHIAAVEFVRSFFAAGKPVAAICHGPQIFIDAEVADGRKLTSYPSIRRDLINAGAQWVDREVVVDQGLVTSRTPDDLDAFNAKLVEEIGEGKHAGQHA